MASNKIFSYESQLGYSLGIKEGMHFCCTSRCRPFKLLPFESSFPCTQDKALYQQEFPACLANPFKHRRDGHLHSSRRYEEEKGWKGEEKGRGGNGGRDCLDNIRDAPKAFHILNVLYEQCKATLEECSDCVGKSGPKLHVPLWTPYDVVIPQAQICT